MRVWRPLTNERERCRDFSGVAGIEDVVRDFTYAVRWLRRSPGFTAAAVLSLGLGIGCNVAIFSLVNSLLLRVLPVSEPERLFVVAGGSSPNKQWTFAVWEQLQQRASSFESVGAWGTPSPRVHRFSLTQGEDVQPVVGMFVSGDYFSLLGVNAQMGRTVRPRDDMRNGGADGPVVVIGHTFWQRQFDGAKDAVGRTLLLNQVPFTIIGVTPPHFFGTEIGRSFDVAVPVGCEPLMRGRDSYLDNRAAFWLNIMLRLKPDQSVDAATASLRAMQAQIREGAVPAGGRTRLLQDPLRLVSAAGGTSALREQYQRPLLTLLAVAALVLLVACANVANLLLARATGRRHEFTVRLALGSGSTRLVRQLFTESLLLAVIGAAVGVGFAVVAGRVLVTQLSVGTPVFLDTFPDWRVLAFAVGATLVTTLIFGTAPARRAARARPAEALREQRRGPAGSRSGALNGLVVSQVALSVVLVVAAGLFVQTFGKLASVPLGFEPSGVLVVNVNASRSRVTPDQRLPLYQRLSDAIAALPRVRHAAASGTTPLSGGVWGGNRIEVSDAPVMADEESTALVNFVTPGWFATYGTPLMAGRDIEGSDRSGAPQVTVVNEAFARKFRPGNKALGATVTQYPARSVRSIVGVVGDAVYGSMREPVRPTMYIPLLQYDWTIPFANVSLGVLPATASPTHLAPSITSALMEIDQNLSFSFTPLAEQVQASLSQERLVVTLSGFFGLLSLLLAGVGIYGVTSYAVNRRRAELSIRVALGAVPSRVVALVVGQLFGLVTLGVVLGVAASLWAARFVGAMLYGVDARDPKTFVAATGLLFVVGALAALLPAWNAARLDPANVLRDN